jgi:hypothetical protein
MADGPENTGEKQDTRFTPGQSGNAAGKPKGARHRAMRAIVLDAASLRVATVEILGLRFELEPHEMSDDRNQWSTASVMSCCLRPTFSSVPSGGAGNGSIMSAAHSNPLQSPGLHWGG